MIYSGTSTTSDLPPGHGDFIIGTPDGGVRENVRVMTFSTVTSDTAPAAAPAGGAVTAERVIIVAPPPGTPPKP